MEEIRKNIVDLISKISSGEHISVDDYIVPNVSKENQELLVSLADLNYRNEDLYNLKRITEQVTTDNVNRINDLIGSLSTIKDELNSSNRELENVFSSITDMLFVLDDNKVITKVNSAVTQTLCIQLQNILNKEFTAFIGHSEDELRGFLDDAKSLNEYETIIFNDNDEHIPVLMSGVRMLDNAGDTHGYVLKVVDLRESRLMKEIQFKQEQLIQSSKLASLGQMASGIAHEINNPLTIISAKAGLLQLRIEKDDVDVEYFKSSLDLIKSTTVRISTIISNLKSFSRDSTNDEKGWHSLIEIINDTLSFCSDKFEQNNIEIQVNVACDVQIYCQSVLISQVLINLLNNSFDAIKLMKNKWIKIESESTGYVNRLVFTDCGAGIAVENSCKIFESFFTTKDVDHGTGLGLSLVKEAMDFHNGTVSINHNIEYTQFILEFPVVNRVSS